MTKDDQEEIELRCRVSEHAVEIAKSFNPQELVPILVERGLLNDGERKLIAELTCRQSQREQLLDYFKRSPELFLQCLEREENHKGHEYIVALVTGVEFAIEAQVRKSQDYEEGVKRNRQEIVRDLDITYLAPVMLKRGLLTWSEFDELRNRATCKAKSTYLLDEVLFTKGPLAYVWLVDCLERERSVPRHSELFELITGRKPSSRDNDSEGPSDEESDELTSSTASTAVPTPKRLAAVSSPEAPLTGDAYESVMKALWGSCHRGQWGDLEREARKLTDNNSTDVQLKVIACMELARSYIFRHNWTNVDHYIQKVRSLIDEADIMTHSRTNAAYLTARAELVLFSRYLFTEDLKRAQEHLDLAKEALFNADISVPCEEDAVWMLYCTGCLRLEQLWINTSDSAESLAEVFETAIRLACSYHKDTIKQHSCIRLAQLYLGCSHFHVGTARDQESIELARHCLQDKVWESTDSLHCRSQALYFIALSDLHRNTGSLEKARECAQKAMDLASVGFRTEWSAAQRRLEVVTKMNGMSTS